MLIINNDNTLLRNKSQILHVYGKNNNNNNNSVIIIFIEGAQLTKAVFSGALMH